MMPTDCGTEGCHNPFSPRPGSGDMMTVNGMINPVITLQAGVWYRKRMLFSSPLFVFDSKPVGDPAVLAGLQCEFHLIAKDNIYRAIGSHVEVCNLQGVVKEHISFSEGEGAPELGCDSMTSHVALTATASGEVHAGETQSRFVAPGPALFVGRQRPTMSCVE